MTSLEKTTLSAGVDTSVLPFGRIKRETLEKAKDMLNQLRYVTWVLFEATGPGIKTTIVTHAYMHICLSLKERDLMDALFV